MSPTVDLAGWAQLYCCRVLCRDFQVTCNLDGWDQECPNFSLRGHTWLWETAVSPTQKRITGFCGSYAAQPETKAVDRVKCAGAAFGPRAVLWHLWTGTSAHWFLTSAHGWNSALKHTAWSCGSWSIGLIAFHRQTKQRTTFRGLRSAPRSAMCFTIVVQESIGAANQPAYVQGSLFFLRCIRAS